MREILTSMPTLTWIGISASLAYLSLLAFKMRLVVVRLRADRKLDRTISENGSHADSLESGVMHQSPEITIMQPILSGDPQLESMLEANLQHTDQRVHFLWLIDQSDWQAQAIVSSLQARLPEADRARIAVLRCQDAPQSHNPKSFKLALGLELVHSPYVAVLDDDTTLPHHNLRQAIHRMEQCDLYTGLPLFKASPGIGSQLVAHFVNNNSLMTYLAVASLLPPVTINGMFYAAKTEYLKGIQAFRQIETELCDDLALATWVKRSGGSIHQGTAPLELRVSVQDWRHYGLIMHRWFVFADILTARQSGLGQATLALLLGLPVILLWIVIIAAPSSPIGIAAGVVVLVARYSMIRRMLAETQIDGLPMNFLWSPLSELLQPIHFVHAKLVRTIRWRHRRIRVLRDGSFHELN